MASAPASLVTPALVKKLNADQVRHACAFGGQAGQAN
jgi:hypothetical protein